MIPSFESAFPRLVSLSALRAPHRDLWPVMSQQSLTEFQLTLLSIFLFKHCQLELAASPPDLGGLTS